MRPEQLPHRHIAQGQAAWPGHGPRPYQYRSVDSAYGVHLLMKLIEARCHTRPFYETRILVETKFRQPDTLYRSKVANTEVFELALAGPMTFVVAPE